MTAPNGQLAFAPGPLPIVGEQCRVGVGLIVPPQRVANGLDRPTDLFRNHAGSRVQLDRALRSKLSSSFNDAIALRCGKLLE